MKKILLLLLFITFASNIYSQESIVDMFKSKEKRQSEALEKKYKEEQKYKEESLLWEKKRPKSNIAKAGLYLEKSAKLQASALSLGAVSSGLLIWYGCIDDKFEFDKKGKATLTSQSKGLIIGGAICMIAAIGCEIVSISYKMKAGKCLRLHTSNSGVGLAFVF